MDDKDCETRKWLLYLQNNYGHDVDLDNLTLKLSIFSNTTFLKFSKKLGIINFKNNYAIISDSEILIDIEAKNTYNSIYEFIEKHDIEAFIKMVNFNKKN